MSETHDLPPALNAERRALDQEIGPLAFYIETAPGDAPPLLLIHSINAAPSAYEVRPIFEHYRGRRTVVALELPGFGFSARRAGRYTPRHMTDAIHRLTAHLIEITGAESIDALACSLSCEYLARAALERPAQYRSLALVSPTGFDTDPTREAPYIHTRGRPWLYRALTASPSIARTVFKGIASRRSIRYFLQKTWGTDDIDEGAFEYAYKTSHQPGARHAPLSFLAGYLFSEDALACYRELDRPIWLAYGTMSDFTDYRSHEVIDNHEGSRIASFKTGALPHFQALDAFTEDYDRFIANLTGPQRAETPDTGASL